MEENRDNKEQLRLDLILFVYKKYLKNYVSEEQLSIHKLDMSFFQTNSC